MSTSVLVAYATKYGSTQEVAETIATTLRQQGMEVKVQPAQEVHSLEGYSAVVLGAALYIGRWHREALLFLQRHRVALANLPIAIFALGPLHTDEKEWQEARGQLDQQLAKKSWLAPVSVELFGGAIDPTKLHFPFNRMPAGDIRDWTVIRAWASKLASLLQTQGQEAQATIH